LKGILFKPDMIKAIMEGRKTQTRQLYGLEDMNRLVDYAGAANSPAMYSLMGFDGKVADFYRYAVTVEAFNVGVVYKAKPRYLPGETVYVKEAWAAMPLPEVFSVEYQLDKAIRNITTKSEPTHPCWNYASTPTYRTLMSMPQWAARTFLLILAVEPQRLQEITEEDAMAEGCMGGTRHIVFGIIPAMDNQMIHVSARHEYERLWDSINPKRKWASNPWLWKYTFKKLEATR